MLDKHRLRQSVVSCFSTLFWLNYFNKPPFYPSHFPVFQQERNVVVSVVK